MAISCQFVRPDRLLYEGEVANVVLVTQQGELGIWPRHASEIVALGDGIVRLTLLPEDGGTVERVIVSGGYAEIHDDTVIILADHARLTTDIEEDVVLDTRAKAEAKLAELDADDHRHSYWESKIRWCDLLLKHNESKS